MRRGSRGRQKRAQTHHCHLHEWPSGRRTNDERCTMGQGRCRGEKGPNNETKFVPVLFDTPTHPGPNDMSRDLRHVRVSSPWLFIYSMYQMGSNDEP